jgi:hypothetical protein
MNVLVVLFILHSVQCSIRKTRCDPVFYPEGCESNEVLFRRVSYTADPTRQFSVFMHGDNSERIHVHTLLVFSHNETDFHNTLLFNPLQFSKYTTLVRQSEFRFNNEVSLLSRGKRLLMQYDVASPTDGYFDSYAYDAALLLDRHSSMWHEYNTIVTRRSQLSLKYQTAATTDNTPQDFNGIHRLQCDINQQSQCVVRHSIVPHFTHQTHSETTGGMWINGRHYPNYQLVIDPTAVTNRLPYEMYMRWRYHNEKQLRVSWYDANSSELNLNTLFRYEAHQDQRQNTVVIGADALRHFQRTEQRLYSGEFLLYYNTQYSVYDVDDAGNVTLALLFILLVVVLMYCLARWFTSTNYSVLHHLLSNREAKARRHFDFQYRQLACEMTALVICAVLWFLTAGITDPITQASFTFYNTFQLRKLMLYIFTVSQVALGIYFLVRSRRAVRAMFIHYWSIVRYNVSVQKGDRHYSEIKYNATHYTTEMKTELVIMRNLVLHNLLASDLLFIFNYKAQFKPLYTYFFVLVSLAILYYYVKYLFMASYFMYDLTHNHSRRRHSVWPEHHVLLLYILIGSVIVLLLTGFSVPLVYIDFLQQTSSAFSQSQLLAFTLSFLAAVCCVAMMSVSTVINTAVTDRLIAQWDKRHAKRV